VHSVGLNMPPTLSVQPTLVQPSNGSICKATPHGTQIAGRESQSKHTTARIHHTAQTNAQTTPNAAPHASDVPFLHGLPRHCAMCLRQAAQVIPRTLVQRHLHIKHGNKENDTQNPIG
jgi:bacterioferritin-associated ferredoxin